MSQPATLWHCVSSQSTGMTLKWSHYYYYYVFILGAISPYTTGLKALFNPSDCTGTAPTHK